MSHPESHDWLDENRQALIGAIARIRQLLEQRLKETGLPEAKPLDYSMPLPPALDRLCALFGLSKFERDLLLLCAGMELDPGLGTLCADLQGDRQRSFPTFHLAMMILAEPHWSAFTPERPLRRWRLLDVGTGQTLTLSPLRIDERILHDLMGVQTIDEQLLTLLKPVLAEERLLHSHQQVAEQVSSIWSKETNAVLPIVQFWGSEPTSQRSIAATACQQTGLNLYALSAQALPTQAADLNSLLLLWQREAILTRSALLLDCTAIEAADTAREGAIAQVIEGLQTPLMLMGRDRRLVQRSSVLFEVHFPTADEQRLLWQKTLGAGSNLNGGVEAIVSQFNLSATGIQTVCTEVFGGQGMGSHEGRSLKTALWNACRVQARPRLDDLAQRIELAATWEDLVLPEKEKQVLQSVATHVRQRNKVYQQWGFASKGGRGLGISALFAGASGTGKTMSAEVIARQLQLDLYRIDLSSVVSKYIGETEKNLRKVFDAAEAGSAILLFDEADALFGKRSDVKDSHDRYANMEVSYLLQRMELYQGLAILTSNLKDAIDTAFLRRIRFIVKFPFPDVAQRTEIWQRIFPQQTETEGLDIGKLAKLNVAGGNIRNIALNAAFLAAEADEPVKMKHLLGAAQSEYLKLERTLTDAEVKGWLN